MVKDKKFLENISQFCLDKAKKLGATDCEVVISNSISEGVSFRNKQLEHSERSDNLSIGLTTYIGEKNPMFHHQIVNKIIFLVSSKDVLK